MTQRAERGMGRAVDEKMSDGEIRYRFKSIGEKFDGLDKRLDRMDDDHRGRIDDVEEAVDKRFKAYEKRSELTWGKILGLATIVATLLAAIVGAWITTKGIK